jgi:UDP-glucose 4-epimerase
VLTHCNLEQRWPARVVILGASGFVGRALAAALAAKSIDVGTMGRDQVDLIADGAGDALAEYLRPDDTIVFLAALTPDKGRGIATFLANIKMGASVCTAFDCVLPQHVIYFSSDAVYPFRTGLVNEESCAEPDNLYGVMHLARELMVKQTVKSPVAVLRPTLIFGAGDTHSSYGPNRFRRMAKQGRITLFGEGEDTRDHIYIDDVVKLTMLSILHRSNGTLNLATGSSLSFRQMAERVAHLYADKVEIAGTPRNNPITYRTYDVTALHRSFPRFRFTPLELALAAAHGE